MNVNIGGGTFKVDGWLNFDALNGFVLTHDATFPLADASAPIVYSSHCFEHLDDATVQRMLTETRRILAPAGRFVMKLPDFERVLERYRDGDDEFFQLWGIDKLVPSWEPQGVEDTLAARAAMIFCGVWEPSYGDANAEFTKNIGAGYHGPVPMADDDYKRILEWKSLRQISQAMCAAKPAGWHFNHRNAWSHEELRYLLNAHHFIVLDEDPPAIPGINRKRTISMYAVCA